MADSLDRLRTAVKQRDIPEIREAAAHMDRVPVDDAFTVCLAFLELDTGAYLRATARFAGRLALDGHVTIDELSRICSALVMLADVRARPSALQELRAMPAMSGLPRGQAALTNMLYRRR